MADKYHSDTQEKIETLTYGPGPQDSGDLEAGTKTITATAEASGIGSADYSRVLTLAKPGDARITVKRIASRLAVTIDSMTAGHLYCRVYVDAQDADHRLFDEDWTNTGAKLDAVDTHSGNKATIFDLLKDGSQHTFYFFFWVNSGNSVISLVQLWEGVGTCATTTYAQAIMELNIEGLMTINMAIARQGTGTPGGRISARGDYNVYYVVFNSLLPEPTATPTTMLVKDPDVRYGGSVATDLVFLWRIGIILRSEQ
jgi:hypothetical protein